MGKNIYGIKPKRRGNPRALIAAVKKNPRMSPASKAKAIKTLKRKAVGL
jgi:hypothetical protein